MLDMLTASASSPTTIASVIIGAGALVSAVAGALITFGLLRRSTQALSKTEDAASQTTLEERLDELSKSMRRSARLVEQVSAELDARAATARQLQKDADTAQALAALHKDQADAIRRTIDAELATAANRIRSDSIKIGIASFFAGGGLTLVVTLFVHPFHP
jgi:hypothetical protein